jgi:hypothetical protein
VKCNFEGQQCGTSTIVDIRRLKVKLSFCKMKYTEKGLVYEPVTSYTSTCNVVNVMHILISAGFIPCYLVYTVNVQ